MKFTDVLYDRTKEIWQAYDQHPFIKGIEDGSLAIDKFQFYMIQDYIYLWDYSKLFAIGALKAEDPQIIASFAGSMDFILNGEMEIHRGFMSDLGISEQEVLEEKTSLINRSYTNYMLSVSQKGGYEEVVAALLSCAWTYADIATGIDKRNPDAKKHEFYGRWIKGYISEDFQESAEIYKNQINEFAENLSEARKEYLIEVFYNCCLYELKFWDMAYNKAYDFEAVKAD
ncbi:MAG: thiaminase II [Clostridiaceae bacterium]|jgi:thiaminase/transcriptional activator TenA|nr:thiaminase II [Bacillota bacterium]NLN52602.1 thiaminase II [Clostridiaceae bacterium]